MRPAAVITGLGAVSPLGVGLRAFVSGLRAGACGVRLLAEADPRLATRVAAKAWGFEAGSVMSAADVARVPALVPMALAACAEAIEGSGLGAVLGCGYEAERVARSRRVGLILGTGGGGIDFTLSQAEAIHNGRAPSLWTITNATHGNLAGELSIRLGLRGPSHCVSDGCASSSDALGLALRLLGSDGPGLPDAWVVVGADAHVRWETLRGMELLKVINTEAVETDEEAARTSRPFDATRAGFVLGEGAWAVVVERESFARAREATPEGEVLGFGATCDAYHRVRPDPEMTECVRAMRLAVEDAGLAPEDVGLAQYHGTSTEVNDRQETAAVRSAFGAHADRLVGGSIKGAIGHPQGACGLASVVAIVGALTGADGGGPFCPPTVKLRNTDPACDLDFCADGARELDASGGGRVALVNCLAFGAKNSALVVRA